MYWLECIPFEAYNFCNSIVGRFVFFYISFFLLLLPVPSSVAFELFHNLLTKSSRHSGNGQRWVDLHFFQFSQYYICSLLQFISRNLKRLFSGFSRGFHLWKGSLRAGIGSFNHLHCWLFIYLNINMPSNWKQSQNNIFSFLYLYLFPNNNVIQ